MSKILGHKVQLALSVLNARRDELKRLQENAGYGEYKEQDYKQAIDLRIKDIEKQISEIKERVNK